MSARRGSDGHTALRLPSSSPDDTLSPPGGNSRPAGSRSGTIWVWVLLGLVALIAAGVLLMLPDLVQQQVQERAAPPPATGRGAPVQPQTESDVESEPATEAPASPETTTKTQPPPTGTASEIAKDAAREQATAALQDYLRARARPELTKAEVWGDPEWSKAEQAAAAGEQDLKTERFASAANHYTQAGALLDSILQSREQRLTESLAAADAALVQNDHQAAVEHFQLALAIEPQHPEATEGLARARSRADVLQQMETGRLAEENGDPDAALAAYSAAAGLDGKYAPATEAVKRVETRIAEQKFNAAMSRALSAMQAGKLDLAGKALVEARSLRPDDPALQDARERLVRERKKRELAKLRKRATDQTRNEKWREAEKSFQQALAVDANTAFAKLGLEKARDRVQLHQQIDHYLGKPGRLQSAAPFENARQLLESAKGAGSDEPKLRGKVAALHKLLQQAGKKITLGLRSDGETKVAIYKVGRLGRFEQKSVTLRPGTYTIVGSRDGYRDVRRVFNIRADKTLPPITIQCTEPL
ncbi:MAG: hypothetical protein U9Q71_07885 [Pseudomonadota bacterium]|nr:hypothetical protein [Pseudomonadota bacterium]